ncbi:TPA: acyltransferase family protein [Citrobacter freundii]|uniref:acyltransferase family protein n=1 Tax=Citrobacter freundii TaxID=546 RepID=UPI0025504777|nr:acyltransferase [Citrobacter freundii]MEC5781337.1 acyltransferase [Citrobacter freundii]
MNNKKIVAFDIIRAISVIMIISFHFMSTVVNHGGNWDDFNIFSPMGSIGVSFFIMISGAGLYVSSQRWNGVIQFYKKRILSIYPPYIFSYFFIACLMFMLAGEIYFGNNVFLWVLTITGFDGYMLWHAPNYYMIGEWFLGFIVIIYAIYPIIRIAINKNIYYSLLISVFIACITYANNKEISSYLPIFNATPEWNPLIRIPEFIFGAMVAKHIIEGSNLFKKIIPICLIYSFIAVYKFDNLNSGVLSIPSLCAIFYVLTFTMLHIKFNDGILSIINFFSVNSFVAFLIHHKIIYLSVLFVKPIPASYTATYLYLYAIILIVFSISYFLSKPINSITKIFINK